MRSRAAWYLASLAAYELSSADPGVVVPDAAPEPPEDGPAGEEAGALVGRLRMRSTGWKAAGGGAALGALVLEPERTSWGIGARSFLVVSWEVQSGRGAATTSQNRDETGRKHHLRLVPEPLRVLILICTVVIVVVPVIPHRACMRLRAL